MAVAGRVELESSKPANKDGHPNGVEGRRVRHDGGAAEPGSVAVGGFFVAGARENPL
jgi:hypothetical protein